MVFLKPFYLVIDVLVIAGPLILTFHPKLAFYRRWKAVLASLLLVSPVYIIWDIIATHRGHWSFNDEYVLGIRLAGLPLEEIFFFITVPYACLFTYEALKHFTGDRTLNIPLWVFTVPAAAALITAIVFFRQEYTFIVLLVFGASLVLYLALGRDLLGSRLFWRYVVVTLLLFVATNIFLTAFPIVEYGPAMIWGGDGAFNGRFFSIPVEDFFYNYGMLAFYLFVYLRVRSKEQRLSNCQ